MPTGYTAKLMEEGQTFEEYALCCARAFGALILMRDDPIDKPIPERFEPDTHSAKQLAEARAELARLEEMGGNERIAFGEQRRAAEIEGARAYLQRQREENARLVAMRAQVTAWVPPSPDHANYKAFMLQQIDTSMNDASYAERSLAAAEAKAPVHYYAAAVASAQHSIEYSAKAQQEEEARTAERNRWVSQLRASLRGESVKAA